MDYPLHERFGFGKIEFGGARLYRLSNLKSTNQDINMFEMMRLHGNIGGSIALQARKGREIPNLIELAPGYREINKYNNSMK